MPGSRNPAGVRHPSGLADAEHESAYFFADVLPAIGSWSFSQAEAEKVTMPTLLVNGAHTRPWFPDNIAVLAAMLPHAHTVTIPNADHLAPLTHPAQLASVIAEHASRSLQPG